MSLCNQNPLVSFMTLLFLFLLAYRIVVISSSHPFIGSSKPSIGITYNQHPTSDLPNPDHFVSTLRSLGVTHVRILYPSPDVVHVFSDSGISLLLTIPNKYIHEIASNRNEALQWLYIHVVPSYPRALITTISVGNEVFTSSPELSASLQPAIENVYFALHTLRIRNISVSTTHSFDIIRSPFPPSAAEFKKPIAEWYMKPLLDFISTTNSSFLINANPYKLYRSYPQVPLGYALFQQAPFNYRKDPMTDFKYQNLYDVMVDAVVSALKAAGHNDIPVVVTETGWPSDGDTNEPDANERHAKMYNVGLIRHLWSGHGTPLRWNGTTETYIFELFDDDMKQGPGSDRHWGILYQNMTMKYPIRFSH